MVRAFTISFEFSGETHLALVSVNSVEGQETHYCIRLFGETLHRLIPGGEIRCCPDQLESQSMAKGPVARRLVACIRESLDAHLQLVTL